MHLGNYYPSVTLGDAVVRVLQSDLSKNFLSTMHLLYSWTNFYFCTIIYISQRLDIVHKMHSSSYGTQAMEKQLK